MNRGAEIARKVILSVRKLTTTFPTKRGPFNAVEDVSFDVLECERVAIVGESGSGKSMTMLSILRLVPKPGKVAAGTVDYNGANLLKLSAEQICQLRGSEISLVFQDPMASWNPVLRIGRQIGEAMRLHRKIKRSKIAERIIELLSHVGIPVPAQRSKDYPHQFSGGMRQRGMIGMALANYPNLLIADEPTTALDVTVQDQIIRLLRQINEENGTAILLVTHNLALVASLCERVIVMYAGRILETGTTEQIFYNPQHPYTWGLLQSIPRLGTAETEQLVGIPGQPIDPSQEVQGCKFHPRCAFRVDRCAKEEPGLEEIERGHRARCWVLMKNVKGAERHAANG
ncbi:MAG: ABC transporter ATP-binding protein [Xanthobacteraceae bacterium]|nr:ABC transporter ATP-binding protein [Xanthobacteraceae bacterium]